MKKVFTPLKTYFEKIKKYYVSCVAWITKSIIKLQSHLRNPIVNLPLKYICIIFIFSFYYYLQKESFYHTTIKYESSYRTTESNTERNIRNQIIKNYQEEFGQKKITNGNLSFVPAGLRVNDIDPTNELLISLELPIRVKLDKQVNINYVKLNLACSSGCLNEQIDPIRLKRDGTIINPNENGDKNRFHTLAVKKVSYENIRPGIEIDKFLPFNIGKNMNDEGVRLKLNKEICDDLFVLCEASKGFPANLEGAYARMLYFSATTMTGLGPGDILPLSTKVRMMVVLESILGLLLVGLFLNALAKKIVEQKPHNYAENI